MNINKAIRKQKKTLKWFMLTMGFIFLMLPLVVYFTKIFSAFFLAYLSIIEILIVFVMIIRADKETLKFEYNNKLKIQNGIFKDKYIILCDRVMLVHTLNEGKDLEIIMILKSRLRNKKIKQIDSRFLKRYSWFNEYHDNLKRHNNYKECYYIIINRGGYSKYELLDLIYRYSVKAYFTEDAIKRIKEYRN